MINSGSIAAEALGSIRRQGAGVALDDFGTGFSSLAELGELPVNALKLDRNLRNEPAGEMSGMIAPLIVLAHEMGLSVVAEQVETEHVRDELGAPWRRRASGLRLQRAAPDRRVERASQRGERGVPA